MIWTAEVMIRLLCGTEHCEVASYDGPTDPPYVFAWASREHTIEGSCRLVSFLCHRSSKGQVQVGTERQNIDGGTPSRGPGHQLPTQERDSLKETLRYLSSVSERIAERIAMRHLGARCGPPLLFGKCQVERNDVTNRIRLSGETFYRPATLIRTPTCQRSPGKH